MMDRGKQQALHYLARTAAALALAVLLACLLAPLVYNGLVVVGQHWDGWSRLETLRFGRVVSRVFLLSFVGFLFLALRHRGDGHVMLPGLRRCTGWRAMLGRGFLIGIATVGLTVAVVVMGGGLVWAPPVWTRWVPRIATYLIGALLIGWLEELFFRGMLFGWARRLAPWGVVAVGISLFFSWVHFISPPSPQVVDYVHWFDGFRVLPRLVDTSEAFDYYWPFALNLFLIGMVLSTWYQRDGHLWGVIGIHAGWVWMLRTSRLFLDRNPEVMTWWWGPSSNVGRSGWTTVMLVAMWIWALCRHPVPAAAVDQKAEGGRAC